MPLICNHNVPLAVATTDTGNRLMIARDEGDGIIRLIGSGIWTPDELDSHFAALARVVGTKRAAGGKVRVLADLRQMGIQSDEAMGRIVEAVGAIYSPHDRVALVMHDTAARTQMRGAIGGSEYEMFVSPGQAMGWLCAADRTKQRA